MELEAIVPFIEYHKIRTSFKVRRALWAKPFRKNQ
jgi:hypothetical protein